MRTSELLESLITSFDGHVGGGFSFGCGCPGESLVDGRVGLVAFTFQVKLVFDVDQKPVEERQNEVAASIVGCFTVERPGRRSRSRKAVAFSAP